MVLLSPSVTSQPAALEEEEEDEGEDEAPTAELKKTVDEPEDKKEEEYDEDDDEKATVDVIKPVPEPAEEAPKTEPTGQRAEIITAVVPHLNVRIHCNFTCMRCGFSVSLYALCKGHRVSH